MGIKSGGKAFVKFLKDNWLSLSMLLAIITGAGVGVGMRHAKKWSNREIMYIGFLGEIFMQLLKGICVPLMAFCIITAFATLDTRLAKIFGYQLLLVILLTKIVCIALGLTMALIIKPGSYGRAPTVKEGITVEYKKEAIDNFLDMINNIFPDNMMDVFFRITTTNITKNSHNESVYGTTMIHGTNMLGIVSISIFIGMAMKALGEDTNKPLLDVAIVFEKITFEIVKLIMYTGPILLIFLIAENTIKMEITEFVSSIGLYALCISATLLMYFLIFTPLVIFIFGATNPFKFYLGFLDGITTSFACSSSMASLPVAIKCLEEKLGYDKRLVAFVVPVSIAINKDGAAIYLAFSTIFFVQYTDTHIGASQYCLIALFALTLSSASPGVPQGSLLMLMVILEALGISPNHAASLIAVDIIVDRVVTVVNVFGSGVCVCVVNRFSKKKRALLEREEQEKMKEETIEPEPLETPAEEN